MKRTALETLRCPADGGTLRLDHVHEAEGEIWSGDLVCEVCSVVYSIIDAIPRFVPLSNYADSFAFQRQRHARLQMDKFSGTTLQHDTILERTGWSVDFLRGKTLLECGCGAGPDTQVLLDLGAELTSVDISAGVDQCRENNYPHARLNIVQASILQLPLAPGSFDVVYCHRVIQHTPDPEAAFREIVRYLKPGGTLFLHSYRKSVRNMLQWKYWLRPLTTRIAPERLHRWIVRSAPAMHALTSILDRNILTRQIHYHLIPYRNYSRIFPMLTRQQLIEYGIHDTFDALSPAFDRPSTQATIERWLREAGFTDYTFRPAGPVIVVARRPKQAQRETPAVER